LKHFEFQIQFLYSWVTWVFINDFNKSTIKAIKHQPKVRKITAFMLTLGKYRTKISVKQLISITVIWWRCEDWLRHFDNVLWDDLLRFFEILIIWRSFFFDLKLRRNIFFKTHGCFTVDLLKLRFFRYFFILVKQRVFGFTKLFLENKFTAHKKLACDDYVKETILVRVNIAVFVNMCIKFGNLGFYFIYQRLVLDFFYSLMS